MLRVVLWLKIKIGGKKHEQYSIRSNGNKESIADGESLVLKDVKYVKPTLIRYQRNEAKKTLTTLKEGIKCSDITGECGVVYFMRQWEILKAKYAKLIERIMRGCRLCWWLLLHKPVLLYIRS